MHGDEDAKDNPDKDCERHRLQKHTEPGGGKEALGQCTLDGEIPQRTWKDQHVISYDAASLERREKEGGGKASLPMTSTVMPNAISVAPNGRPYGATATPSPDRPLALALTETRNSCTRAIWIGKLRAEKMSGEKERKKEEGRTDAGGCK
jgi:hypothetical protein